MLVLTRMEGEEIVLRDPFGVVIATVQIVSVRGDRVRVGVAADRAIAVHRKEVDDRARAGLAAAGAAAAPPVKAGAA